MKDSLSVAPIAVCAGYLLAIFFLSLMSSCKHVATTDKPVPMVSRDCFSAPQADGGVKLVCVVK